MGGLTVRFGKWDVQYFLGGESTETAASIGDFDELYDRMFIDHPRVRRILVQLSPRWNLMPLYLHWSDGTDLKSLDSRIASGLATETDFAGAVVGQRSQILHPCGAYLRVLALAGAIPFLDDPARLRAHTGQTRCPVCGDRVGFVLEFVDVERVDEEKWRAEILGRLAVALQMRMLLMQPGVDVERLRRELATRALVARINRISVPASPPEGDRPHGSEGHDARPQPSNVTGSPAWLPRLGRRVFRR